MKITLGISDDIMQQHLDVLVMADAFRAGPSLTDAVINARIQELWSNLLRIGKRFLSDSPTRDEKRQFTIAVLEEAVQIAKDGAR